LVQGIPHNILKKGILAVNSVFNRLERIFEIFPDMKWYRPLTPFERLVSTILSQNTSREATIKGFENLRGRFKVTPEVLAEARIEEIKECIKPSGLYNTKAPRIKELARIILEEFGGDLNGLSRLPLERARERLLRVPGIGFKTADVFFMRKSGLPLKPLFPGVRGEGLISPSSSSAGRSARRGGPDVGCVLSMENVNGRGRANVRAGLSGS
jgi:3-methyladenine DNA glycosylase/8-oxoguanine DNA glycosylase